MDFGLILDVIRFEVARAMTKGRIMLWLILIGFPIMIIAMMRLLNRSSDSIDPELWYSALYFLIPEVSCSLGLMLWACSAISTEIEGQTWIYLAMRRSGRTAVFLGKYANAILWAFSGAAVSITVCMLFLPLPSFRAWAVLCMLALASCAAHGAVFALLGVIFHKRTMASAVVYMLAIEYGMAMVPALASRMTVNYRTRALLIDWMDWNFPPMPMLSGIESGSSVIHLCALGIVIAIALAGSLFRLATAEYPTQQDG